ncbi:MAG: hypothetical protein ACK5H2_03905 [Beutenbergiaceae bacterium]
MNVAFGLLLVLHLIGWAIVLGGVLTNLQAPRLAAGTWHGVLTALVTGLLMVGLAEMGDADVNHIKIGVKLLIALALTFLIWRGRKQETVTRAYLLAIAGLTLVNIGVAVLWR